MFLRSAEKLEDTNPIQAARVLGFIKKLYDVDAEAGDDTEKRRLLRHTKSRALVKEFFEWRMQ